MTYAQSAVPEPNALKAQARALRKILEAEGISVGHTRSLELLARQYGFRSWNVLSAASVKKQGKAAYRIGERLQGLYLGRPFRATVTGIEMLSPGWVRLKLKFDQPVDAVSFDSFSAFRQHVTATIGQDGGSRARTSDGFPHVLIRGRC